MQTFYATEEQSQLYLKDFIATYINCDCGQTEAVYIDDQKKDKIVICDACHSNCTNQERYF